MNVTVVRRALWLVAALALGYTIFAFLEWRPVELVIAAGLLVVLIPVDMLLHLEERARRRSPFGPILKWGHSGIRYHADAPFWAVESTLTIAPPVAKTVIPGGNEAEWHQRQAAVEAAFGHLSVTARETTRAIAALPIARREPWWRRMYRRLPWWSAPTLLAVIPSIATLIR